MFFSPAALFRPVYTLKIFGALRAQYLQFTLVKRGFGTPISSNFSPAAAKIQEISPNFENLGGFLLLFRNYPKFFGGVWGIPLPFYPPLRIPFLVIRGGKTVTVSSDAQF